jgi:hypothetical protein
MSRTPDPTRPLLESAKHPPCMLFCRVGELGAAGGEPCLSPGPPRVCLRDRPCPLKALRRLVLVDATAKAEAGEMLVVGNGSSDVRGMELARL